MNRKNLEEIIELADKALLVTEAKVINTEVEAMAKTSFISIGGVLDSIKILAQDNLGHFDETRDAIDRPERHSISGHANDPSAQQKYAFEKDN